MRWVVGEDLLPHNVRCFECQQEDAVWIPDLGFSTHVSQLHLTEADAAVEAVAKLRNARVRRATEIKEIDRKLVSLGALDA